MADIRFDAEGWQGIIAKEVTVENVALVACGISKWILANSFTDKEKKVVIGYDDRFGGKMFAETAAKVFAAIDIKVFLFESTVNIDNITSAISEHIAEMGIFISSTTESQMYSGIILRNSRGERLTEGELEGIEEEIPEFNPGNVDRIDIGELSNSGMIVFL